jgi:hypothetical protein
MIKALITFAAFATLIHLSIVSWRSLGGLDKWALTKTLGYSMIISASALLVLFTIVVLF